jgi:CHAD domain-containing protein
LVRIADGLIEEAVQRIRHPSRNRAEDLHEVRVTIKYLRAILRLVHPTLSNAFFKRENARLRGAAKRLAPLRDIAVARSTIRKALNKLADRKDRDAFRIAQRGFEDASLAQPQSDEQREAALRQAADALGKTGRAFEAVRWPDSGWEAIEPGLETLYRQNRAWMSRALATRKDRDLHQWRKRAKFLYYQLQMLTPIWPERLVKTAKRLNELQDYLGADHDFAVLLSFLLGDPVRYGGRKIVRRITRYSERRRRKVRQKSKTLGRVVFSEKPDRFTYGLRKRWNEWHTMAR